MKTLKSLFCFFLCLLCAFISSRAFAAENIKNEDCLACHDSFHADKFAASVHANNLCTSCHRDIHEIPHPDKLAKVDCASCHRLEAEVYHASDHGKALASGMGAASCLDCHGADPHHILSPRNPESPVHRLNIPKTCASCHEDSAKMAKYNLLEHAPLKSYLQTVHGKALERGVMSSAVCTDCHGSHDLHAPSNPQSKIFKRNVPATCGKCHENVLKSYERSIHGKAIAAGKLEAPVCTDCHGEHTIKSHKDPESSVFATSVSEKVCGQCHAAEKIVSKYGLPADRLKTYLTSYHGLASKMGVATVANCASCHGAHDILPASDPQSSVNKANLAQTCGKCHPNVGEQLAKGSIHIAPSPLRDRAVYFVTIFYIFLITLVIGGMLLHNLLDFLKKLRLHYRLKKSEANSVRFNKSERIQHLILFISFTVLAYSGFALKFPDAWWGIPLGMRTGHDWRGVVHRVAALIFIVLCVYHAFYLMFTRRGRDQVKSLWPKKKDFTDLANAVKYNLEISKIKPSHGRYSYVEKAEYWALVWGSAVMVATGLLLVFENITMKWFPKWAIDVALTIHFYEAVLATAAIVVWHFYFTIFDPDHYPMNWSMMSGKAKKGEGKEEEKK